MVNGAEMAERVTIAGSLSASGDEVRQPEDLIVACHEEGTTLSPVLP
jgi:hypothetical protein